MWTKIKQFFIFASESGLRMPAAYDQKVDAPSSTLFYTYIAFLCCLISIIFLYFKPEVINPSIFSILLFVICLVMYRLKRLDEIKIDLDDKQIELKGSDDNDSKQPTQESEKK